MLVSDRGGRAVGRAGRPEEVAAAALFLAANERNFVAGAELVVDSGHESGLRNTTVKETSHAGRITQHPGGGASSGRQVGGHGAHSRRTPRRRRGGRGRAGPARLRVREHRVRLHPAGQRRD
ncbi:SDR family oxidoreductase [Cellulomonas sp.]|uniref:SDR family oxidoreductase n=1 Tax=Cellulomonas sp. TaxID=40001 RepID=UPI0025C2807E|nr:SDR family oxidoreductase [Cellulomonas sp.]